MKFEQSFVNEYLAWNLHDQDVFKKGKEEGIAQGISQGLSQGIIQTAKKLLLLGLPLKTIVEGTGLTEDEIEKLR